MGGPTISIVVFGGFARANPFWEDSPLQIPMRLRVLVAGTRLFAASWRASAHAKPSTLNPALLNPETLNPETPNP